MTSIQLFIEHFPLEKMRLDKNRAKKNKQTLCKKLRCRSSVSREAEIDLCGFHNYLFMLIKMKPVEGFIISKVLQFLYNQQMKNYTRY